LKLNKIKILILDVDGTMTDGGIYLSSNGELMKKFNVKDGYGLVELQKSGIEAIIITGRYSEIVEKRAEELSITKIYQNVHDKAAQIEDILKTMQINWENIAYIGDDMNDIICIEKAGFSACPNDAIELIKKKVKYVCKYNGGYGAVREVCDILIKNKGISENSITKNNRF